MESTEILNVTVLEPRMKHPTIFRKFDELQPGTAFTIHNDHDPKPLYYQLLGERGDIFTWEYLEQGPEWWKVRITKKGGIKSPTVGEIVAKDIRKAEVFKKLGIDFCCGGKQTVSEACRRAGVSEEQLAEELRKADHSTGAPSLDPGKWELDFLADFILNTHHAYIRDNTGMILEIAEKVAGRHGDSHPEVITILEEFNRMAQELSHHMMKEEQILFPYIKEMARAGREGKKLAGSGFGTVRNPINMMESEHELEGGRLHKIGELSSGFNPPVDACTSFRMLYSKLRDFGDDLLQHIHLENNILFPKAVKLEEELLA